MKACDRQNPFISPDGVAWGSCWRNVTETNTARTRPATCRTQQEPLGIDGLTKTGPRK